LILFGAGFLDVQSDNVQSTDIQSTVAQSDDVQSVNRNLATFLMGLQGATGTAFQFEYRRDFWEQIRK
jgi:hypothetical protein